jgi:hypothetical protein
MSEPFCLVSCEDCKKLGRTCWKDKARNAAPTMLSALDECEKLIDLLMVMRKHINHLPKPYRFTPDQDKFIYETIKKVDGIRLAAIAKAEGGAK